MAAVANSLSFVDFSGLKWVGELWGSEPRWIGHLDREAIKQTVQSAISLPGSCTVKFLAQGAFNKLYIVRAGGKEVVMRVTLPVDPKRKTLSEVVTLRWVRANTHLPVPKVLAYGADRTNLIGFEYIIMEKMRGRPLADVWQKLSFNAKAILAYNLVLFYAETFQPQTKRTGNLFPSPGDDMRRLQIGRIVSPVFFWGDHIHQDILRGPFRSSKAWISARLILAENDYRKRLNCLKKLENPDEDKKDTFEGHGEEDEDEDKDYVYIKDEDWQKDQASQESPPSLVEDIDATELAKAAKNGSRQEHQEDRAGSVESFLPESSSVSSALSSSKSSEFQDEDLEELENTMFIISKLRSRLDEFFPINDQRPEPTLICHDDLSRHNILVDENGILTGVGKRLDEKPIKREYPHDENGEVAELYWEHLENYELTQLRRIFLREMREQQPRWVEIFESSQRQRDFDLAVTNCGDSFSIRRICNWLKDMDSGVENFQGLEERIENASL